MNSNVIAIQPNSDASEVIVRQLLRTDHHVTSASSNKGGGLNVGVSQVSTYELSNGEEMELVSNYTEKCTWFPHPDLHNAFKQLRSHLAFLAELPEAKDKSLQELEEEFTINISKEKISPLDRIYVTAFESDGVSVKLTGHKLLNRGKQMPLNPPAVKWNEESAGVKQYEFLSELQVAIATVQDEALLYKRGKVAPSAPDLFSQDDEELE